MADEIERLLQRLKEAEAQVAEEQQRRKEAETRAAAEELKRIEEQHLRKEEQRRREEEQRRREEAEAITLPTTLEEFLQSCHEMSLTLKVVTDQSLTTQGDVTKPAGRLYPQRIIPWDAFPSEQEETWAELSTSPAFAASRVFPSVTQLDYVRSHVDPIDSEDKLRDFAREAVEKLVQIFVAEICKNSNLRMKLGLQGRISFESHTNLGQSDDTTFREAMRHMSINDASAQANDGDRGKKKKGKKKAASTQSALPRPQKGKGGGRADQFCIYRHNDGQSIPAVAIEYKAPHKLMREEIVAGLSGEIVPDRDVIDKEIDSLESSSKWLLAAVITQCFSYMVNRGVQYGYIFTGDAIVFLHIPNDPTVVYYYVSVPKVDVQEDDEHRLHRTAVAQVSTFVLRALAAEPPPQKWHQAASALKTWAVEYVDVLKKIPETERKLTRETFSYRPLRWIPAVRSRVRSRSQCLPVRDSGHLRCNNDGDSGDSDRDGDNSGNSMPSTPTPQRITRSRSGQTQSCQQEREGTNVDKRTTEARVTVAKSAVKPRIEDQPYCTHACLLGLKHGGPLDRQCPNLQSHGKRHVKPATFLRLIQQQLATDFNVDADCKPLYLRGLRGALFKVRLSSHGYTLVAKGVEECNFRHLQHEHRMYEHASPAQGMVIPVCLGQVKLEIPYFYDGGVYTHMLLLSWAGRPLSTFIKRDNKSAVFEEAKAMLQELHRLKLLHKDPALRNMLWDNRTRRLMWTDLERAKVCNQAPLRAGYPTRKRRKLSYAKNPFVNEIQTLTNRAACWVF